MVDFNRVNDALENGVEDEKEEVKIELVTLSGIQNYTIEAGMTVKEFKEAHDLDDVKIVDEDGDVMRSNDVFEEDGKYFTSTPKKNG